MSPKAVPTASQLPSGLASMALARVGFGKSILVGRPGRAAALPGLAFRRSGGGSAASSGVAGVAAAGGRSASGRLRAAGTAARRRAG